MTSARIDAVKVSASIIDGVLEVWLPKLKPEPEKKKIKIKPQ
jgi:HSP20 family molecular chaperone IbpA